MANIIYRQMPAPRELSQQIPAPWAKAWMQKPQGLKKFLVQIPGVRGGDGYGWNWYLHYFSISHKAFEIWSWEPSLGPNEQLKRPCLTGVNWPKPESVPWSS